jgi:hypothetical protein
VIQFSSKMFGFVNSSFVLKLDIIIKNEICKNNAKLMKTYLFVVYFVLA